jgi:hypothetical protein
VPRTPALCQRQCGEAVNGAVRGDQRTSVTVSKQAMAAQRRVTVLTADRHV